MEEKNIEMNGVQYEIKSLIEFSSLARLLFDLSKRQKDIEQNIISIQNSINDKDNRLTNLENKIITQPKKEKEKEKDNIISNIIKTPNVIMNEINTQIQNKENDFDSSNKALDTNNEYNESNSFNEIEQPNNIKEQNENNINNNIEEEKTNKNNNIFDNNIIDNNNDNKEIIKDIDIENKEKEKEKEKENKIENVNEIENTNENIFETKEDNGYIKLDPELISRLFKKINDLEKKINQINSKTTKDLSPKIKSNLDNINNINTQLRQCNETVEEVNKKFFLFKEEFDKIKVKVEDFNIYDIFKGDASNGGNVDVNNALIQALEKKVFKKFELYDEKNKKNEQDLLKHVKILKI